MIKGALKKVLPLLAYLGVALLWALPALPRFFDGVIGLPGPDLSMSLWSFWYAGRLVAGAGDSLFHTTFQFYPAGFNPVEAYDMVLYPFLSVPLQLFLPINAAYNLLFLLSLALGGWGAFLLVRHVTGSGRAAFLSGLLYLLCPFTLFEGMAGSSDTALLAPMPFFALFAIKAKEKGWRYVPAAAVLFALTSYGSLYYGVAMAGFSILLFADAALFKEKEGRRKERLMQIAASLLLGVLMVLPLAIPLAADIAESNHALSMPSSISQDQWRFFLAQPQAMGMEHEGGQALFTFGNIVHQSMNFWPPFTISSLEPDLPPFPVMSYYLLALAVFGFSLLSGRRFWSAYCLILSVMALGPLLKAGDSIHFLGVSIPLPYMFFYRFVPFSSRLHWPYLFAAGALVGFVVLAGFTFDKILGRLPSSKPVFGLAVGLTLIIPIVEMVLASEAPAFFRAEAVPEPSPFYRQLAREPSGLPVLEIPVYREAWLNDRYLLAQTVHGRRMLNGMALPAVVPKKYHDIVAGSLFLENLRRMRRGEEALPDSEEVSRWAREVGLDTIILHKDGFDGSTLVNVEKYMYDLFDEPVFVDSGLSVFKVRAPGTCH